jgi:hypothetical protein
MNLPTTLALLIPLNVASYILSSWSFRRPDWGYYYFGAWMLVCAGLSAYDLAVRHWSDFGWAVGATAVYFISWWLCRRRRKRRRATELAGYKAKAIAEKMAARQRETAQRRPVLQPGEQRG